LLNESEETHQKIENMLYKLNKIVSIQNTQLETNEWVQKLTLEQRKACHSAHTEKPELHSKSKPRHVPQHTKEYKENQNYSIKNCCNR